MTEPPFHDDDIVSEDWIDPGAAVNPQPSPNDETSGVIPDDPHTAE